MYAFSYIEMNGCCILLLIMILKVHLRSLDKSATANAFTMLVCSMMFYALMDLICGLIENDTVPPTQLISSIVNVLFFCASYAVSYLSYFYAMHELDSPWAFERKLKLISLLPVAVLVVLTVLTLKWKFFFYIDGQGNYLKGPLYVPMLLLAYSYVIITPFIIFYHLRRPQFYLQRKKLKTLASFVTFPLIAGTIQAMNTGVSIICFGGTLAAVQVFINLQETRITIDPLTGINNRMRLMQVLESQMAANGKETLYFLMMDVDCFKEINDQYGHTEGDNALRTLAQILRDVCGDYSGILARYGGDEFAVVLTPTAESAPVDAFRQSVRLALQEYNNTSGKPYELTVSIGWAQKSGKLNTVSDLIAAADKKMYADKQHKKGRARC